MRTSFLFLLSCAFLVGCEFNKSGPDQRSNFGEELSEVIETKEMSEEIDALSAREKDFKELISLPELKVGALKRWASSTSQFLSDFVSVRGERLSASAKQEIQNTIEQLEQVQIEMAKKDDQETIPYELQSGVRSLLLGVEKPDFKRIGSFVQTLSQLEELKSKANFYFTGEQDVTTLEIESWMMEAKKVIQVVNDQFSAQLIPPLKREIEEQQKLLDQMAEGILEMKLKGTTVITGKEILKIKKVVDAKADLKQFITSLKKVELTQDNFRTVFLNDFSLIVLIEWAQQALSSLIEFQSSWSYMLEKEELIQLRAQISQLENIIPYLLFSQEKEIKVDRGLIDNISNEVKKDSPLDWQKIGELVTQTYGDVGEAGSVLFESLPIEHGHYIIEEEKILVTASLVRHIPHFERVRKFEEKLQAKTGFVMMDMLTKGEEIQNMGVIKKAMAYKSYKKVLNTTRSLIENLPKKEKHEFKIEFAQYQSDLEAISKINEIRKNERLAEGIKASRCLSFYLLEQDEKSEAESCPI